MEKVLLDIPDYIKKEFLYNIDLTDNFFDTLRDDYQEFDEWFKNKQAEGKKHTL